MRNAVDQTVHRSRPPVDDAVRTLRNCLEYWLHVVRRGETQTAVHLSDAIDQDRLNQHVNGYRIEVIEPLRKLRIVLDETEGIAADLTWEGLFDVVQEQPHILRSGNRVTPRSNSGAATTPQPAFR